MVDPNSPNSSIPPFPVTSTTPAIPTTSEVGQSPKIGTLFIAFTIWLILIIFVISLDIIFAPITLTKPDSSKSSQDQLTPPPVDTSSPSPQTSISSNFYSNSTYGFSVEGPIGWTKQEDIGAVIFQSPPDQTFGVISVSVQETPMNLAEYATATDQEIATQSNYQKLGSADVTIAGLPARIDDYLVTRPTNNVRQRLIYTVKSPYAYLITFTCGAEEWDKCQPVIDKVTSSLKITL